MSGSDITSGGGKTSAFSEAGGSRDTVPVLEEKAVVEKEVATGRVRVATHTRQIEGTATATLNSDEVEVSRVPVGKPVSGALPETRTEGDTTIVPVFEEVLVVEKRLMLKEELHIRRKSTQERVEVPVSLRKQEAVVERTED